MPTNEQAEADLKMFKCWLSTGHSAKFRARAVADGKAMVDVLREWIDLGMPLTAVSGEKQPAADNGKAAVIAAENERLKTQLKLAQESKVQPSAGISKERETELITALEKSQYSARALAKRVEVLEKNEQLLLESTTQLQADKDRLTALLAKQPMAEPAKVSVGDFDQTPEAEEARKRPVVDHGLLPNGLPPGKTRNMQGEVVDAEPAPF